ncbi:hypothetical protein EAY64_05530 [Aquitalea palustris]|uniref:Uncharacterized protein n=1 Tax=Aquitalea palustris TaxID=2480983 RepID=A0A454JKZ2_9NEIS|nr:hypothetical protein [Aquitalea palustris]RMD00058.1 hypothetical protein EAY64_05530 [Aquitalea palustris]
MSGYTTEPSNHLFDTNTAAGQGRLKGVVDAYGAEDYVPVHVMDVPGGVGNVVGLRMTKSGVTVPFPGTDASVQDISVANGGTATNAPTINYSSGRFTALAGATQLVISNSQVTALTKAFANLSSNDSTGWIKNVVPGAGTITINLGAALTANANIDFHLTA